MSMRDAIFGTLTVLIDAVFTAVISAFLIFQARSAVAVRPNLAEVGFIQAAVTNHTTDWIMYHTPEVGVAMVFICLLLSSAYVSLRIIGAMY